MNGVNLFSSLEGNFHYQRTIRNQQTKNLLGFVAGQAKYNFITYNELFYSETGNLRLNDGKVLKTYQEYIYAYSKQKQVIEKYFSQNKQKTSLFYALPFESLCTNTLLIKQLCQQDLYEATYHFPSLKKIDQFKLMYRVNGPQKEYLIETLYIRSPVLK